MAFTCFGELPAEIRIIIVSNKSTLSMIYCCTIYCCIIIHLILTFSQWRFSVKHPRTLDVWSILDGPSSSLRLLNGSEEENLHLFEHFARTVPNILHANHESRCIGFEYYTLILSDGNRRGIYCNFELDGLCAMAITAEDENAVSDVFVELTPEIWGDRIVFDNLKERVRDGWRSREWLLRMQGVFWECLDVAELEDGVGEAEMPPFEVVALVIRRNMDASKAI